MQDFKFKKWKAIACCIAGLLGFHVQANEWTPPFQLDIDSAMPPLVTNYTTQAVEIASNSSGQTVAVWKEFFAGANANPRAAYFDGYVWSPTVDLSPAMGISSANRVSVSINESGIAAATWQSSVAPGDMYLSIYSNGSWPKSPRGMSETLPHPTELMKTEISLSFGSMAQVRPKRSTQDSSILQERL